MYKLYKMRKKYHFKDSFDFLSYPLRLGKYDILVGNDLLIKRIIKNNLYQDMNLLVNKTIDFLNDDEDNEGVDTLLLDEFSSLYNLVFNLYSEYFTKKELNLFSKNIRLLVNEIKMGKRKKEITKISNHMRR